MSLSSRLVLFDFLLHEFGANDFDDLAWPLRDPELEGPDIEGATRFHHALVAHASAESRVGPAELRTYDTAIRDHTTRIGIRRESPIQWRYFQYLMLLFTERFLHRLFEDQDQLLDDLNAHVDRFNQSMARGDRQVPDVERTDLRKLAFWSATGSGKTLVMHVNLLQLLDHLERFRRKSDINKVLLLTPNEGLSRQHRDELALSGIEAELFRKDSLSLFTGRQVEIIDVHKLRDEGGDRSVAIAAFGDNNLVLVDEGHRGAGGEHWMSARERLCSAGFSFEYSATFGQAFARNDELQDRYAKWIAFDYSYSRFHRDGYGKDFRILNYPKEDDSEQRRTYLVAALLSFVQQQRYYDDQSSLLTPFMLEKPLWAFVGSSVTANAVRTEAGRKVSDVLDILLAFAEFLAEPATTADQIEELLVGGSGLLDGAGSNVFAGTFTYLSDLDLAGQAVYADALQRFFNASSPGPLRVVRLRGVDGELALQVGDNDPFGVVNVGDAAKLHALCADEESLVVDEIDADSSLFEAVNDAGSRVNLVVGAKKFIEGWNSWRVSSLGLLRVGQGEGPQIIQLFGRGVRLKGLNFTLKRSSRIEPAPDRPEGIELLETLTVFGLRANYMATFRDQLELDGTPTKRVSATLPTTVRDDWPTDLKTIRLQPGADFVAQSDRISLVPDGAVENPAIVNWYARLETMTSSDGGSGETESLNEFALTPKHLAFLDRDNLLREVVRYKSRRGWHNLVVTSGQLYDLLKRNDWYRLYIPPELVAIDSLDRVALWQQVATALVLAWCERRFKDARATWQQPRLQYQELDESDPNVLREHEVSVPADQDALLTGLSEAVADIASEERDLIPIAGGEVQMLNLHQHLYGPLLHVAEDGQVIVQPTALNEGEQRFLLDLSTWCRADDNDVLEGRTLHVLRNQTRGRGVGFFEAGNFYPDFILWLTDVEAQRIAFVDPKGIVRSAGFEDPKIQLSSTIKDQERRLGDERVRLSSFIVVNTRFADIPWWNGTKKELEDAHVLFQHDDRKTYIEEMMQRILSDTSTAAV